MRGARTWIPVFLVVASAAVACERTPPEDFPQRPAAAPTAATAVAPPPNATTAHAAALARRADGPHRCVLPTPPEPPPPVAPGPAAGCPADPEAPGPPAVVARVTFRGAPGVAVDAEVVRSEHDTMRGLMYRTSLGEDHGMLFDLRARDDHQFWMHNTCIPLDLLFIDQDGLIVGIVENAPTLDDRSRGVGCPSRYVLEVNAGWARRHGVKAGQWVNLPEGG